MSAAILPDFLIGIGRELKNYLLRESLSIHSEAFFMEH
jgi:hypothetical protein